MRKTAILVLGLLLILCSIVALGKNSKDVITLTKSNVITLRGEVSQESVSRWMFDLNSKPAGEKVYLFLDSPGGDMQAANLFIDNLQASDKDITCIVSFAASAMFAITQACPIRVILPSGVLMQHSASIGMASQPVPNQVSFFNFILQVLDRTEKMQAARLGIDYLTFKTVTRNDLWLLSDTAIAMKAADRVGLVTCDVALTQKTYTETVATFFGPLNVTVSSCPLLSVPIGIAKPKSKEAEKVLKEWFKYRERDNIIKVNTISK